MGRQMHFICTLWMAHITANQSAVSGIRGGWLLNAYLRPGSWLRGNQHVFPHSNRTQASQAVQKRWLFASPGTGPELQSHFICPQATWLGASLMCVLGELKERCRTTSGQAQHKVQVRCSAVKHSTMGPVPELLLKKSSPWAYGSLPGLREESSGMPKGRELANTIYYEHSYCNRKGNQSRKGSGRIAALREEVPGRIKKPRTKIIVLLALAVLSIVALSTFTGVAMGWAGFVHTRGDMLTGVQVTYINAVSPKVPWGDKVIKLQQLL